MVDLSVLLRLHVLSVLPLLGPHPQEGVVAPTIVPQPLLVKEDSVRAGLIQESSVVRDANHRLLPRPQELFEPRDSVHIQMIRGLVKE